MADANDPEVQAAIAAVKQSLGTYTHWLYHCNYVCSVDTWISRLTAGYLKAIRNYYSSDVFALSPLHEGCIMDEIHGASI
jgi:hypothetical protein